MRTTIAILSLLLTLAAGAQQTNVIFGNVADYGMAPQPDVTVTATLLRPNPRQVGNVQVRVDPVATVTDSTGAYSFTNFQYGFYQLDISGQGTTFRFNVWTNTTGAVAIGSLVTNAATLPPQPGTNYYTQAQVDALIASIESRQLHIAEARTNLLWGTNLTVNAAARPLAVYWVYSNNVPLYGTFNTNFP